MTKSLDELGREWDVSPDFYPAYIKDLRQGRIKVADGVYVNGTGSEPWKFEHSNPTMYFRLHSFGFLAQLVSAWVATGDPTLKVTASKLVVTWIDRNGTPDESRVWHGHQTALRSSVLAGACGVGLLDTHRVAPSLRVHAERLMADENYDGAWNHGIDQCLALLDIARVVDLPEARRVAIDRIVKAIPELVDDEGMVAEQASHYAGYVYSRLRVVEKRFDQLGVDLPREFARVEMIPEFLAWATRPDGTPVPIGDTMAGEWKTIEGEVWELGNSEGRPTHPVGVSRVYRDGWAFFRSGWKGWEHSDSSLDSLVTVRYGTYRRIHGHRDHTSITWFAHGHDILSDPGFSGYGDKKVRDYELLEHSHNGVVVEGAGKFRWQSGSPLVESATAYLKSGIEVHSICVTGQAYEHARRTRSVLHIPAVDLIVVRDYVESSRPVTVLTNWLTGPNFRGVEAEVGNGTVVLRGDSLELRASVFAPHSQLVVATGSKEPYAGWVASGPGTSEVCPAIIHSSVNQFNPVTTTVFTLGQTPQVRCRANAAGPTSIVLDDGTDLHVTLGSSGMLRIAEGSQIPRSGFNLT